MNNVLLSKSEDFAVRIINLYKYLAFSKNERVLSKQILRSGTNIGANYTEAKQAISKKEFLTKAGISLKECAETSYWLRLLYRSDFLTKEQFDSITSDCDELMRLLTSTIKTTRSNLS